MNKLPDFRRELGLALTVEQLASAKPTVLHRFPGSHERFLSGHRVRTTRRQVTGNGNRAVFDKA
jgi:hypothetical protein